MLEWKSIIPEDEYEASAAFSENSHYEISTMTLKGKKHLIRLKMPLSVIFTKSQIEAFLMLFIRFLVCQILNRLFVS